MAKIIFRIATILSLLYGVFAQFDVPDALVEVFEPKGLRVSIPDVEGIKLFAFHGKINEEMNGREGGYFSRDIVKAKNGRWTFWDPTAKLKVGDIIYYWTYIDYFDGERKLGYPKDDQYFEVKELLPAPAPPGRPTPTPTPTPKPQPIPDKVTTADPNQCRPSITKSKGQDTCSGQLIFDEPFDTFRSHIWTPEVRFAGEPDFEFVIYQNRREVVSIKDGKLIIRPILTDALYGPGTVTNIESLDFGSSCTGIKGTPECIQKPEAFIIIPPVTSAKITTQNHFSFIFGKIEIRAKLPKGDWLYPELYLNSRFSPYGPHYDSGSMRIAFLAGNDDSSTVLKGGLIFGSNDNGRNYGIRSVTGDQSWAGEFHNYWLTWNNDSVVVGVDDKSYGTIYAPTQGFANDPNLETSGSERWKSGTKMAPFDQEMHITIGVGVGGHNFEDRIDDTKPWKNSDPKNQKLFFNALNQWTKTWGANSILEIDYIKVWAI